MPTTGKANHVYFLQKFHVSHFLEFNLRFMLVGSVILLSFVLKMVLFVSEALISIMFEERQLSVSSFKPVQRVDEAVTRIVNSIQLTIQK